MERSDGSCARDGIIQGVVGHATFGFDVSLNDAVVENLPTDGRRSNEAVGISDVPQLRSHTERSSPKPLDIYNSDEVQKRARSARHARGGPLGNVRMKFHPGDNVGRVHQNEFVDVVDFALPHGRSAQLCSVGADDGDVVLYFHSPATSGEELSDAADVAVGLRLRLLCVKRPSIACAEADRFVSWVADDVTAIADELEFNNLAALGWSGGAPYALAAAAHLGPKVTSVHLVSPIPGPLTGPDAVPGQTERLRQVANTTATSSWVSGSAALRDYRAVGAPWTFNVGNVTQPTTIWSPIDDQIVPPHLIDHLRQRLANAEMIPVAGGHDWLTQNWHTVLSRVRR